MEFCDIQERKQCSQSINCSTCKCNELAVDLEGVKLEQVISQNDIKVNNYNVEVLNDVVNALKVEVCAMQKRLENHVKTPTHSKLIDCSTQTTDIHYN